LLNNILPFDEVEGDGGQILGRLVSAAESIFAFVQDSDAPHILTDWATILRQATDVLLESDSEENVRDLRILRRTIANLPIAAQMDGSDEQIDFAVVRHHLTGVLGTMEQKGGFLTGGVTFCALKPAQSIPACVIFVLGLNEDLFPRKPQRLDFDLMSKWRLGDPNPREDDRYSF